MHLSEILTNELTALAERTGRRKLDLLETGTIRGVTEEYQSNDGWSTLTLAAYAKVNGGKLTSIDLDVKASRAILKEHGLSSAVRLTQGHSIEVLSGLVASAYAVAEKPADNEVRVGGPGFLDLAFLDSSNDGSLIFHEFLIVRHIMRSPGVIIVDDVDMESTEVVKGQKILPYVLAHDIPHRVIERRGSAVRTGVLVFEV